MKTQSKIEAFQELKKIYKANLNKFNEGESLTKGMCVHIRHIDTLSSEQRSFLKIAIQKAGKARRFVYFNEHCTQRTSCLNLDQITQHYVWKPYRMRPRIEWINKQIRELKA